MAARFGYTERQLCDEWEAYSFSNKRVAPSLLHLEKLEHLLQEKQNKSTNRTRQAASKPVAVKKTTTTPVSVVRYLYSVTDQQIYPYLIGKTRG